MDWTIIASIYTILAFYVAWTAFYIDRRNKRQQRKEEKKDILISVKIELELMKTWLGTSYSDANYKLKQDPWHPFHMVYGLGNNDATKNTISLKSVSLLSEKLLEVLVELNQKLGSFEQHVNRLIEFNTSEPTIATKSFYYYDTHFAQFDRVGKWTEFEKLANKLSSGKKLSSEQIHLIGSVRILKDLHIFGIGAKGDTTSLRYSYYQARSLIEEELDGIGYERQFMQNPLFAFLDTIIFGSILFGLCLIIQYFSKGGVILASMNSLVLIVIFSTSLVLGLIKYGSLAGSYGGKPWQLKFVEIWNDFINFSISGLIGYYFIFVKWPLLSKGELLSTGDFFLIIIFILGLFGHLCVMSKNITDGVEAILKRVLVKE